eukprot:CAMPEP_0182450078 /NCGR_PEP_ID=MMETSP1172-20130603/38762_1 /TAXON_ID=708627 /ORGANISM="Timspurckia oligopyrenoides, Strain CCMP3278" /LENGTH=313 /DNA_ID=CAMNT_0024647569 /DNA_START=172 /DNA_END=1110 /DNA_ORIENTATION=+
MNGYELVASESAESISSDHHANTHTSNDPHLDVNSDHEEHKHHGSTCTHHHHGNENEYSLAMFMPHGHSFSSYSGADSRLLTLALVITLLSAAGLAIGGVVSHSHVLLVEALHTAIDSVSVILALLAASIARWKPTSSASFGYARAEILAGLTSVAGLLVLSAVIFSRAAGEVFRWLVRYQSPAEIQVKGGVVVVTILVSLVLNVLCTIILSFDSEGNINTRAARAHAIADASENLVVLVAGVIIWWKPAWQIVDPVLSIVVVCLILVLNFGILHEACRILMEFAPENLDVDACRTELASLSDVDSVVALHFW